jgi:phage/plasmid-like protein (TIGR03299 family)
MSRETYEWLNTMILVGYTDQRGHAWHYKVDLQSLEPNHYPGAIPVEDVERRLFNFEFVEAPVYYLVNGEFVKSTVGRKGMLTSDTNEDLGSFKSGYQGHDYREWLLENVSLVLDDAKDELGIGSAGLLRSRGVAFVSIEVPQNIVTPEGVEFRPNLLATTSFDGTVATTYKRVNTRVVCDNTQELALSEVGQEFKAKHTRYSGMKIHNAREALEIVHTMSDDFAAEVAQLAAWKVSDAEFETVLTKLVPVNDELSKAGITRAENKRNELLTLWRHDDRVAPWKGTALGATQAFNTWNQHYATIRKGVPRAVRNMENVLNGKLRAGDVEVLDVLRGMQLTPAA